MRPDGSTSYKLAVSGADYAICHRLLKERGDPDQEMSFPTVIARREGRPIGFLSTYPNILRVTAGKLVVKEAPRPLIIALRLAEAYEHLLKMAGVSFYFVPVEKGREDFAKIIQRMGDGLLEKYAETETDIWYKRTL